MRKLTKLETVTGETVAVDLNTIVAVISTGKGVELCTADDVYHVKGDFGSIVAEVERVWNENP